ncbi:MAG: penicillin-binding transpeptidase domain-containing protein [Beutenbergiaceae bacterium]
MVRRASTAVLVVTAMVVLLAACSDSPSPRPVADALAGDLADGAFDEVAIDAPDVISAQLTQILGDLVLAPRTVEVVRLVEPDGEPEVRVVELGWQFELPDGGELSYQSQVRLELVDNQSWRVAWTPAVVHPQATAASAFVVERIQPERGLVTGYAGEVLVEQRDVVHIGIDKQNYPDEAEFIPAAQALADALALADAAKFVEQVRRAGPSAYVVALTIRTSDQEIYALDELRVMPGVLLVEDVQPLAPTAGFARPLLGTAGEATAEIIDESEGQVQPGDIVGLTGLQRSYDDEIGGTVGMRVLLTDTSAGDISVAQQPAVNGSGLATTFASTLQIFAEDRLAGELGPAALVAIQASTGQVLVAASGPGSEGLNTATVAQNAPGSTFKMVTALALLRAGLTPDSPVDCTETITVDGREFTNYPGYPVQYLGSITLREAIAQSCNTALIAQHELVDSAALADAAASLGLAAMPQPGRVWAFPYYSGSVPDNATGTTHAADLIGQGEVLVSPLAMAGVVASIAAGRTTFPVVVTDPEPAPVEEPALPLTQAEAEQLQELMFAVVTDGTAAFLQDLLAGDIGAKTGTAQFGLEQPPQTHSWMIAFSGDLAVAVFVAEGESGAETAGPIMADFLVTASEVDWQDS